MFRGARNVIRKRSGKNVESLRREVTPIMPFASQHGVTASRQCGRHSEEGVIRMGATSEQATLLRQQWASSPRWTGIKREYTAQDVIRLRSSVAASATLARRDAGRLWNLLRSQAAVRLPLLGADQAAGPAQASLAPVVADAEAGSGADAFGQMTALLEAGAAGVHFEDQLPGGGRGGKVLIPTGQHIKTLTAARLAADVLDVPALLIARTGANAAGWLTSDTDERDHEFLTGERAADGAHRVRPGLYACVTRGLAFAPYADLLCLETPAPDLAAARAFANIIHSQHPDKLLAYHCPPSGGPDDWSAAKFQRELAALGYRLQLTAPAAAGARHEPVLELVR
jgi:isocitrate lyase